MLSRLQEALGMAYVNNPALNAERVGVRAVKKTRTQAIARFLPTISATAGYGDRNIDLNPTEVETEPVYADLSGTPFSDLRVPTGSNPVARVEEDIEIKPATQFQISLDQVLFDWRSVSGLKQVDAGIQRQSHSIASNRAGSFT